MIFKVLSRLATIAVLFISLTSNVDASPSISGADLSYKHVGANQYEVTLSYYYNCTSTDFPPTNAPISVFSINCNIYEPTAYLPIIFAESGVEITNLCASEISAGNNTTCNSGNLQGIKRYVYRAVITLPVSCSDWRISYNGGTRFDGVTNIVNPQMQGLYVEVLINNSNGVVNSSPFFASTPTPFFCLTSNVFEQGVYEEDGDVLKFSIITPLSGYNTPISYQTGYSNIAPLSAGDFNLDISTGRITFTPILEQVSVICLLIEEYRNQELVGTTMRNLQFSVLDCYNQFISIGNPETPTQLNLCLEDLFTLTLPIVGADQVTILGNLSYLTNADFSYTATSIDEGTATFSWTPQIENIGVHYLVLSATNEACPYSSQSTKSYILNVLPKPQSNIVPNITLCQNASIPIMVESEGIGNSYQWTPSTGLSCSDCPNPILTGINNTTLNISITDPNGCTVNLETQITVLPSPFVNAGEDQIVWEGQTAIINATGDFNTITWMPSIGLDNPNIPNPVASITQNTTYIVSATSGNGCTATDTIQLKLKKCDELLIPNAFSPNMDGINDLFLIADSFVSEKFELRVFDRWGNQVFFTANMEQGWDGTLNGTILPMGNYAYYCEFMCGNVLKQQKGNVFLLY